MSVPGADRRRALQIANKLCFIRLPQGNDLYGLGPPVNIGNVLALLRGFPLRVCAAPEAGWSSAVTWSNGRPVCLWHDAALSPVWQRYALAAALGHALLHRPEEGMDARRWSYGLSSHDPHAREATWFANELLSPLHWLEPLATARRRTEQGLADDLGVPVECVHEQLLRLHSLG